MKAAIVSSFDADPRFGDITDPVVSREGDLIVEVLAAAIHPRVRSQASGSHYTSTDELPLVPGIDGVGRDPQGRLRYFVLPDTAMGSMAERTVIDERRSIVLPEDCDPVAIAAAANPAMSSWVALRQRIAFEPGSTVLVLGATGSAGRLAVQVASLFGAGRIVAAGRDSARLAALGPLGADELVSIGADPDADARLIARAAADVDVVIDYVWGPLAAAAMAAIVTARPDRGKPLTWVEIGSVGGPIAGIPSAALRAARLQLVGSGQGSVSTREIIAELPALAAALSAGTLAVDARTVPLSDVESAWADRQGTSRIVLIPTA